MLEDVLIIVDLTALMDVKVHADLAEVVVMNVLIIATLFVMLTVNNCAKINVLLLVEENVLAVVEAVRKHVVEIVVEIVVAIVMAVANVNKIVLGINVVYNLSKLMSMDL